MAANHISLTRSHHAVLRTIHFGGLSLFLKNVFLFVRIFYCTVITVTVIDKRQTLIVNCRRTLWATVVLQTSKSKKKIKNKKRRKRRKKEKLVCPEVRRKGPYCLPLSLVNSFPYLYMGPMMFTQRMVLLGKFLL